MIRGGLAARRPVGTFWYFSKSDDKSGTVHAGVDFVEQSCMHVRQFIGGHAA
jgi:hypothetical protein